MFFKPWERVYAYGIGTSRVRAILSELYRAVRRGWGFPDAVRFAELLLRGRTQEERVVGIELLGRFVHAFRPALLVHARRWLAAGSCDNWALTDDLCLAVLGPFLATRPRFVPTLRTWVRSPSVWVRRAAAVSLVPLARHGVALATAYGVARALFGDSEDLIHKATGWLLRDAGKTDPARLEAFLRASGRGVPRTTLRYAIERFPGPKRRAIMAATRRPRPHGPWTPRQPCAGARSRGAG